MAGITGGPDEPTARKPSGAPGVSGGISWYRLDRRPVRAFLRRWTRKEPSRLGSILLGIGSGVAFHVQPALVLVVLGWLVFELWWRRRLRPWAQAGLVTLGMILACLPWGWRTYRTFDAVFFVRSNLGLELRMGNHDGAAARGAAHSSADLSSHLLLGGLHAPVPGTHGLDLSFTGRCAGPATAGTGTLIPTPIPLDPGTHRL